MKAFLWFVAGLGVGEFLLRWAVHAIYWAIIISLLAGTHWLNFCR